MCMKDLNVSTIFCESVSIENEKISFCNSFEEVPVDSTDYDTKYVAKRLNVVSFFSALSTDEDKDLTKKYDVLWTLGFVDDNGEFVNQEIGKAVFDVSRNKIEEVQGVSNRSFTNQIVIIDLDSHRFKKLGKYFLKVYLKESGKEQQLWQLQTMNAFETVER